MKIIKQDKLKPDIKRITCENCGTIFERMNVIALRKWELCTMDLALTTLNVLHVRTRNILIGNKERANE